MPLITRLFRFTTIVQAVGEGGISTGMSPLSWGPLGISVSGATTDGSGQSLTRATGWLNEYSYAANDRIQITAGSGGTTLGAQTVSGKTNNNTLTIAASIGASKTGIAAWLARDSLAGGVLDYPASLPGPDTPPNEARDFFTSFEPSAGSGTDPSKILRFGGAVLIGDGTALADVLAADNPSSIASVGFGCRISDIAMTGTGIPYSTRIQLRNSGGAFGATVDSSDPAKVFSDGGAAPSGILSYYLQPGLLDQSLSASVAQLSDAGFAVNFQLAQATGDAFEATGLVGVNGPLLKLTYSTGSTGGGARGRGRGRGRTGLCSVG